MERRSQDRCEVCHGPTKFVGETLVCRNSLCSFNHRDVECPRCKAKHAQANGYEGNKIKFSCGDCLHTWVG